MTALLQAALTRSMMKMISTRLRRNDVRRKRVFYFKIQKGIIRTDGNLAGCRVSVCIKVLTICCWQEKKEKGWRRRINQEKVDQMKDLEKYMAMPFRMEVVKDLDESGFVVYFPDLPGCISCGETIEKALANAEDAKKAWLEAALDEGIQIYEPK